MGVVEGQVPPSSSRLARPACTHGARDASRRMGTQIGKHNTHRLGRWGGFHPVGTRRRELRRHPDRHIDKRKTLIIFTGNIRRRAELLDALETTTHNQPNHGRVMIRERAKQNIVLRPLPPTEKTHSPLKKHVYCCSSLSCFRFTANCSVLGTCIFVLLGCPDAHTLINDAQGLPRSAIARNMNTKVSGMHSRLFISIPHKFDAFYRPRHWY